LSTAAVTAQPIRRDRLLIAAGLLVVAICAVTPTLEDCFRPLSIVLGVALCLFAALSPPHIALAVAIASCTVGIVGRVQVVQVGMKAVAIRPEEAAIIGLWLGHGWRWLQTRTRPQAKVFSVWLLFSVWAALSFVLSMRLWSLSQLAAGSLYVFRWFAFGGVLLLSLEVGKTTEGRRFILRSVVGCGVVLSVLGFAQLVFVPDMRDMKRLLPQVAQVLTDPHIGRLVSTVLDPNLLGVLLAPAGAIAFAHAILAPAGARARAWAPFVIILVAIVLTISRSAMLALGAGCATVAAVIAPRLLWGLVAALPGVALLAPKVFQRFQEALWRPDGTLVTVLGVTIRPEPSAYARVKSWVAAARIIGEHPFLGVGYNNYGLALAKNGEEGAVLYGADATLMLIAATCGLFGFVLYAWTLFRVAGDAFTATRLSDSAARSAGAGVLGTLAAMLVASIFTNGLIYPPALIFLWSVAGVSARWAAEPKRQVATRFEAAST
jgi:hypothetical protein